MSRLPTGWTLARIGDLVQLNPKQENPDEMIVGFVPMAMLGTNYRSTIAFEPKSWGEVKKGYTQFMDGDVLLAKITPCFENGKAGLVSGLPNAAGAGSTEYFVNRPFPETLDTSYLLAFFKTETFLKNGETQMTGSVGHKRVPKEYLLESRIPLAPRNEQKRIADKLDAVLARVDACRDRLDRIPAILKRFRQSVLAMATTGKLTEEWRETKKWADASADLNQILYQRSNQGRKVKAPKDHLNTEEFAIPDNWIWVSLDSLSLQIVDGTHHTPTYVEKGVPFISVKDIQNGKIDFSDTKFITAIEHKELTKRCNPQKGDLLITKSGTIGRTAIISTEQIFSLFVSVALIKPASPLVNMNFIDIALRHWIDSIDISSRIIGTAIKNLHLQDMRVLAIPFPPLVEQTEIVRRVESLFAYADRLEARYHAARGQVEKLTPALLAKAFRGELIPQDPSDEPASELLSRIAAVKPAQTKKKSARKQS
jgi:type I restriction enzyme, S subunit